VNATIEHQVSSGDLIQELSALAPNIGGNDGGWPGLTIYRFTEPTEPSWEEIQSLSLGNRGPGPQGGHRRR
jgi:hypothetical protein